MTQVVRWFRQNAYGKFTLRVIVALGSAAVAVALSFFPYDTILQAIWVVVSSMTMGYVVLHQRLNETDDKRYQRLFQSRFSYLKANDPEALNTIFADNLRPRVFDWFQSEQDVDLRNVSSIDALDSLAKNGDDPGQLIFRTGIEMGKWVQESRDEVNKIAHLEATMTRFIKKNESLLGQEIEPGVYLRHIRMGENQPTGIHMFHPESRLLFSVKYYAGDPEKHAVALSTKSQLFESADEAVWTSFKKKVLEEFKVFQPSNGGSGPQKKTIPFFVGAVTDSTIESNDVVKERLLKLAKLLPTPKADQKPDDSADAGTDNTSRSS